MAKATGLTVDDDELSCLFSFPVSECTLADDGAGVFAVIRFHCSSLYSMPSAVPGCLFGIVPNCLVSALPPMFPIRPIYIVCMLPPATPIANVEYTLVRWNKPRIVLTYYTQTRLQFVESEVIVHCSSVS